MGSEFCLRQAGARGGAAAGGGTMVEYRIRPYRDEDYDAVREVFAASMSEYAPALCQHVLRQPWVLLLLGCTFCLLLASARSLLLPVLAVTLLLALARHLLGYAWSAYIERCLADDLHDIAASYAESAGARFWVAEVDERVVGTVGARPGDAEGELALKRMAVRKGYRGSGIATALGRTVLAFARQSGCQAVVLNTLMVQHEARALYERLGFCWHRRYVLPTVYGHLANCTITVYRYDLSSAP
ncbi:probable N-acetyltransferase camello isoform X1 [Dryobates pubescens]|uniref:probable N-acetyltransferase camello isoform X1 n=2 Tax=Dryobates pubescens TaxID=118200 RepID=UPI0023B90DB5|nr:probable N-acetyltransferase camello isoform X1 [Dryobates pubescens]